MPVRQLAAPVHPMTSPCAVWFQDTPGRRKLILATNVAETAVTIDGVACVINSGRAKEKRFDPYSGVSTLQTTWISKASEKQRRGRAGRTRTGVAFHMYSHQRADSFQVRCLPRGRAFVSSCCSRCTGSHACVCVCAVRHGGSSCAARCVLC